MKIATDFFPLLMMAALIMPIAWNMKWKCVAYSCSNKAYGLEYLCREGTAMGGTGWQHGWVLRDVDIINVCIFTCLNEISMFGWIPVQWTGIHPNIEISFKHLNLT